MQVSELLKTNKLGILIDLWNGIFRDLFQSRRRKETWKMSHCDRPNHVNWLLVKFCSFINSLPLLIWQKNSKPADFDFWPQKRRIVRLIFFKFKFLRQFVIIELLDRFADLSGARKIIC